MAGKVNVGVENDGNMVIYDRAALPYCQIEDFSFEIKDAEAGKEQAVFQIKKDGNVIREHISKPFDAASIKKKSMDLNEMSCVVKVKKASGIKLEDYFSNSAKR